MTTTTTKKNPSAPSARALPPAFSATLSATKKCAFCARRNECRAICGTMFGFCNADFLLDADRVSEALRLARRAARLLRSVRAFCNESRKY